MIYNKTVRVHRLNAHILPCDFSTQTEEPSDAIFPLFTSSTPYKRQIGIDETISCSITNVSSVPTENDTDTEYEITTENCSNDLTSDGSFTTIPTTISKEKKYVVFESMLDELFMENKCSLCGGSTINIGKREVGTCVFFKTRCMNDHIIMDWKSQPLLGKMPAFNLLMSAAIFCSGNK